NNGRDGDDDPRQRGRGTRAKQLNAGGRLMRRARLYSQKCGNRLSGHSARPLTSMATLPEPLPNLSRSLHAVDLCQQSGHMPLAAGGLLDHAKIGDLDIKRRQNAMSEGRVSPTAVSGRNPSAAGESMRPAIAGPDPMWLCPPPCRYGFTAVRVPLKI